MVLLLLSITRIGSRRTSPALTSGPRRFEADRIPVFANSSTDLAEVLSQIFGCSPSNVPVAVVDFVDRQIREQHEIGWKLWALLRRGRIVQPQQVLALVVH